MKKNIVLILILALALMLGACGRQTESAAEPVAATGIIGAMDEEVASLKDAMEITATKTIAGMEFF